MPTDLQKHVNFHTPACKTTVNTDQQTVKMSYSHGMKQMRLPSTGWQHMVPLSTR